MRDYREYKLSWKERVGAALAGALGIGFMIFLFFSHARSYGWVRSCGRHTGAILSEEETAGTDAPAVGRGVSGMFEYAAAGPANGTIVRRRDSGGI